MSDEGSKRRGEFRRETSETIADLEQEDGDHRGRKSRVGLPEGRKERRTRFCGIDDTLRTEIRDKAGVPRNEEDTYKDRVRGTNRETGRSTHKERGRESNREPRSVFEETGATSSRKGTGETVEKTERILRELKAGETKVYGTDKHKQVEGKGDVLGREGGDRSKERMKRKDGSRKESVMANRKENSEVAKRDMQVRTAKRRNEEERREVEEMEMEVRKEGTGSSGEVEDGGRGIGTRRTTRGGSLSMFTVVTCTAALCYVSMTVYTTGVVRTLERRFSLSSFRTGLIRSCSDIGHICAVIFVAYFGRKVDRLRILSLSVCLAAVAGFLMASPYFIFSSSSHELSSSKAVNSTETSVMKAERNNLCHSPKEFSFASNATSTSSYPFVSFSPSSSFFSFRPSSSHSATISAPSHSSPPSLSFSPPSSLSSPSISPDIGTGQLQQTDDGIHAAFYVLMAAHLIKGIGGSGIFTMSMSYVDENAPSSKSAFYTGVMTSIYSLGPIMGMTLSAVCLVLPETLRFPAVEASTDATWIGCWWLGYLVNGVVLMLASLLLCFFPMTTSISSSSSSSSRNHLPTPTVSLNKTRPVSGRKNSFRPSFKEQVTAFGRTSRSLFRKNPMFLVSLLQTVSDAFVVTGVQTNVVRFIEVVFNQSASVASIIAGLTWALPGALGSFCGGLIMSRLRLRHRRPLANATRLMLLSSGTFLFGLVVVIVLFIGCPEIQLAGERDPRSDRFTVVSECNSHCACSASRTFFTPVCGSDGLTYFSGCFAGCKDVINETLIDCGCIQQSASDHPERSTALLGVCRATSLSSFSTSDLLIPFAAVLFVISLIATLSRVPATIVSFRIVSDDERCTAFGISSFAFNVFGLIPGVILSGYLIDSTCLLWEQTGGGACLHFSSTWFRCVTMGAPALFEAACFILIATLVHLVKRKQNLSARKPESSSYSGGLRRGRGNGDEIRQNYVAAETIVTHL